MGKRADRGGFLIPLAAAILALAVYSNSLKNDFVWDDNELIVDNPSVHSLSNIPSFFAGHFWSGSAQPVARGYYRPLISLTYAIGYAFWGPNPFGFHLMNIFWHALASALVAALVLRITADTTAALVAGALFAVHPAHAESVAFISGRTDVIATVLVLLSLLLFLDGRRRESGWFVIALSAVCFSLALLAKEVAAVLPALLLLVERTLIAPGSIPSVNKLAPARAVEPPLTFGLRPSTFDSLAEPPPRGKGPLSPLAAGYHRVVMVHSLYWIILAVYLGTRFWVLRIAPQMQERLSGKEILFTMPVVVWDYIRILIAPIYLCADYVVGLRHDLTPTVAVAIMSLLILWGGIGVLILRKSPSGFFAVWVFLGLLPALQIVPISVMKAERFLYLPSVGFCALAGLLGACIYARTAGSASGAETHARARLCILAFALVILALSFRTVRRNTAWKDEFTLYRVTASCAPGNFRVQYNLGNAYFRRGDIENAVAHTEIAFRLRPDFPQVSYNLGLMYSSVGRFGEAETMYRKAIESDSAYSRAHNNLAAILFARGQLEEARSEWSRALALDPSMEQAEEGLGLLDRAGR
jgi:hypothetical protein